MKQDRLVKILALAGLLTLLSPAFCFAQKNNTGTIVGNVGDEHGAPLAGAKVTLTGAGAKSEPVSQGSTDGTGQYRFEGLKPGRYAILFEAKGTISKTEEVRVKAGHKTTVNERLKPPAAPKKPDTD
jgi:Carboxypeptidase regulatory-like domain